MRVILAILLVLCFSSQVFGVELLIYNKLHWMDELPADKLQEQLKNAQFKKEYDARYRKGDIVEVREDGYWTKKHGYNKKAFGIVIIPGVSEKAYMYLMKEQKKIINGKAELIKCRRYQLDPSAINLTTDVDKKIELSVMPTTDLIDKEAAR